MSPYTCDLLKIFLIFLSFLFLNMQRASLTESTLPPQGGLPEDVSTNLAACASEDI